MSWNKTNQNRPLGAEVKQREMVFGHQFFADKRKKKSNACCQRVFAKVPRRLLQLTISGRRRERREDVLPRDYKSKSQRVQEQSDLRHVCAINLVWRRFCYGFEWIWFRVEDVEVLKAGTSLSAPATAAVAAAIDSVWQCREGPRVKLRHWGTSTAFVTCLIWSLEHDTAAIWGCTWV